MSQHWSRNLISVSSNFKWELLQCPPIRVTSCGVTERSGLRQHLLSLSSCGREMWLWLSWILSILWLIVSFSLKPSIKIMAETFGFRSICFWGHLVVVRTCFSGLLDREPQFLPAGQRLPSYQPHRKTSAPDSSQHVAGFSQTGKWEQGNKKDISVSCCLILGQIFHQLCFVLVIVTEFLDLINTQGWGITQECIKSGNDWGLS